MNSNSILALLPTGFAACALILGCSQSRAAESEIDYNRQYRSNFDVPLGSHYTGRSPFMKATGEPPPPRPAPARPAPPAVVKRQSCSDPTTGIVRMGKKMPAEVTLGQEFMCEINLVATECVGNVVVMDRIQTGAPYVRSEPPAEVDGDRLVWRLNELAAGETREIKVWFKAEQEGRLINCATVSADPRACAETLVGRPALAVTKKGAEMAQLGNEVVYNIVVSNGGTALAKDVVLTDTVPDGFSHSSGQRELSFNVGDLAPSQSKSIAVTLHADKRGKFCNGVVAVSSNAGKVNAEACTTVVQPSLKIVKTGDKEQLVNKQSKYNIVVSNTGDTTLTGVVVTDTAAAETAIMAAEGATVSGNTATWTIGTLEAGTEKSFAVILTAKTAGNYCNTATVATTEGLRESSQACTVWKGVSALLLEKADHPDPIQIGETTTYSVKVTNQGTADDTNVKLVVEFPKELTPVSADNGGQVSGQTVTFPPFPTLRPQQAFEYHVIAKGAVAGDARVKFIRTSDEIPAPTTAEESTRVY